MCLFVFLRGKILHYSWINTTFAKILANYGLFRIKHEEKYHYYTVHCLRDVVMW